jgi:PAS domain S-box-containing protein
MVGLLIFSEEWLFGTALRSRKVAVENGRTEDLTFYRTIVESAPEAIFVHNKGELLFGNAAFIALAGFSAVGELVGRSIFDFILFEERWPEDPLALRKNIQLNREYHPVNLTILGVDGRKTFVEMNSTKINYEGRMVMVNFCNDLSWHETRNKRTQERAAKLQARIEILEERDRLQRAHLKLRSKQKSTFENAVVGDIKEIFLPYLEMIKHHGVNPEQKKYIDLIELKLKKNISPLARKLTALAANISPQEIQVASLIIQGKATKEISEILYLSDKTIETHRRKLRKKLGITNKSLNLRTHLLTLQ